MQDDENEEVRHVVRVDSLGSLTLDHTDHLLTRIYTHTDVICASLGYEKAGRASRDSRTGKSYEHHLQPPDPV